MALTPDDVQLAIKLAMKAAETDQTHRQAADRLRSLIDDNTRIADNMDTMAKAGELVLIREDWDGKSETKRYRLP